MTRKTQKPPRSDGAATKARLLEAAGFAFAAKGYADTTSKAVADAAGADLASINYHFGSRSGLYEAVLGEAHARLVAMTDLSRMASSGLPPREQLRVLMEALVASITSQDGWHAQVLAREIASPSIHLQGLMSEVVVPKLALVRGIISAITGIPEDDPAALRCLFSVGAPCLALLLGRNLPGPVGVILQLPNADLARHLHSFAMAGLLDAGSQYKARP